MKKLLAIPLFLLLAACADDNTKDKTEAPIVDVTMETSGPETVCYIRTEGNANQDTSAIRLVVDGDKVVGEIKYLPWEKDAAVGNVIGIKEGDLYKLNWTYSQEGMESTMFIALKTEDGKAYTLETTQDENGNEVIKESGRQLEEYMKVDCLAFPGKDY